MSSKDRSKWNRAAPRYESFASRAAERRWARFKQKLFAGMEGRVLFLAAGTGLDFQFFPPGREVVAIDVSERMLRRAAARARRYHGAIHLQQMDVRRLAFLDETFDQVYTSCTFCSVSEPLEGLGQIRRVLRPNGMLRMFEHTISRWFPFNAMLHACTPLSRRFGPDMNRPTVRTVQRAGFEIRRVERHYLDVLKSIEARKPAPR
jgi:ubiquinone/menaquinone biosynthesis C-methylase UbiE